MAKHFKCSKCHHEWDSGAANPICGWCGADKPEVLEEETSLTQYVKVLFSTPRRRRETFQHWTKRMSDAFHRMYPK